MKIPANAIPDIMILRKKEIRVLSCALPHGDLLFYPDNPRIYSAVWLSETDQPSQEDIFRILAKSEHVRETLVPSIRNNGGLMEPILVRDNVVLEGNSRLAAYRLLSQQDGDKWQLIRARVLPSDISDSEVFSLLGEYHMVGKKDWPPYEQAGYLYRRFKNHDVPEQELAAEVGMTIGKVRHAISVYSFMVDHEDRNPEKWSYYDELIKGRRFDAARKLYPNFDKVIAQKIKAGEISRAVDLRDLLPKITKAGGNTLRKFMNGTTGFDEAADDARLRGAGNYHAQKLKTFRNWLAEDSIDAEMGQMSADDIKPVKYELDKIYTRVGQLIKRATRSQKH